MRGKVKSLCPKNIFTKNIFTKNIFNQKYFQKKIAKNIFKKKFTKNISKKILLPNIFLKKKVGAKPPCCPQGYRAIARSQSSTLYYPIDSHILRIVV